MILNIKDIELVKDENDPHRKIILRNSYLDEAAESLSFMDSEKDNSFRLDLCGLSGGDWLRRGALFNNKVKLRENSRDIIKGQAFVQMSNNNSLYHTILMKQKYHAFTFQNALQEISWIKLLATIIFFFMHFQKPHLSRCTKFLYKFQSEIENL